MKTHAGAKKRIKITRNGKMTAVKANRKHLLQNKTKTAKRRDMHGHILAQSDKSRVLRALCR